MKRLLKEPLVHFLVLGALLFAGYGLLNRNDRSAPDRIVVSKGQLASIMETFMRTRQRPPTGEEWDELIQARVREEVYYREALVLGLDKDDTVIRRRLRQKMEFISDDNNSQTPPQDSELNSYLQAHPDKFSTEQNIAFRHVYLNPEKHGDNLTRDAAQLLAKLNQADGDTTSATMGDPFLLESSFTAIPADEIAKQFGREFEAQLRGLQPGQWQGPIESAFGVHLVLISERTEGRLSVRHGQRLALLSSGINSPNRCQTKDGTCRLLDWWDLSF